MADDDHLATSRLKMPTADPLVTRSADVPILCKGAIVHMPLLRNRRVVCNDRHPLSTTTYKIDFLSRDYEQLGKYPHLRIGRLGVPESCMLGGGAEDKCVHEMCNKIETIWKER